MAAPPYDVAIVGAGAAGLTAAIFAAQTRPGSRIALLERSAKIGAKILISGGGRCNVTNAVVEAGNFNGTQPFIRNVLAAFDGAATIRWFESLGVVLKQEEHGKLFPITDRARTVVDALLQRCRTLGVEMLCEQRVEDVCRNGDDFVVATTARPLPTRRVILATGGRSLPRTGSDGSGWEIARRLGHSVTPTFPALVPLVLHPDFFHATLSGLSHEVSLSTFVEGKLADRRRGSLLFTHFGVSGPVVLDASRHWVGANSKRLPVELRCSFVPDASFETLEQRLLQSVAAQPRKSVLRTVTEMVSERLGHELLRVAAIDPALTLAQLARPQRRALVHALIDLVLPVEQERGWDYAEVTAGGVPLQEVSFRSLESRRQSGLFLIGEMLDCDGRIGGFNFQWAWSTGYLAGCAAVAQPT